MSRREYPPRELWHDDFLKVKYVIGHTPQSPEIITRPQPSLLALYSQPTRLALARRSARLQPRAHLRHLGDVLLEEPLPASLAPSELGSHVAPAAAPEAHALCSGLL